MASSSAIDVTVSMPNRDDSTCDPRMRPTTIAPARSISNRSGGTMYVMANDGAAIARTTAVSNTLNEDKVQGCVVAAAATVTDVTNRHVIIRGPISLIYRNPYDRISSARAGLRCLCLYVR